MPPAPTLERHATELRAGECWYRVVTDPIVDEQGQASRFVLVMTDITSLRGLADAERRRADELLEDNRRKDEFLAMLAHELRNPLNAIAAATALQDRAEVERRATAPSCGRRCRARSGSCLASSTTCSTCRG